MSIKAVPAIMDSLSESYQTLRVGVSSYEVRSESNASNWSVETNQWLGILRIQSHPNRRYRCSFDVLVLDRP
jgi:hypothetical protein